jgi:hypothetical protein
MQFEKLPLQACIRAAAYSKKLKSQKIALKNKKLKSFCPGSITTTPLHHRNTYYKCSLIVVFILFE